MDTLPNLRDLDLLQIRRFLAVVDTGSFVAAARRLSITQQALSTSLAKMESLAGVQFLDRKRGGRVGLTVFGRLLLGRARALVALSEQTMSEIGLLRDARGGSVAVGIGETMTGRHVAAAIGRYHRQQPDVQLRLVEGYTEAMIGRLIAGEVDFVIGGPGDAPGHGADIEYRHLFEIRDVIAMRRDHPLTRLPHVTLADLARYSWIVPAFRNDVHEAILIAYLRASLPPPSRIIRSDAPSVGTWLLMDDDYVCTVSPDMIGVLLGTGAVTALRSAETTIVRHACAITRRGVKLSPAAQRLIEEIALESATQAAAGTPPIQKQIVGQPGRTMKA